MDERKIQSVGGGTYTVSLPKEWARAQDLTAGSVVTLHTHIDDLLVLQARSAAEGATGHLAIAVDHEDPTVLERDLRAAYAAGFEEIVLEATESFTEFQRRTVQGIAGRLVGVTVAETTDSRIVVKTLLDASEVSIRQSVRQLQFVALSMHRNALAALTDDGPATNPVDRDDEADRLYAMIDRHFARGLVRLDEVDALSLTRPELFELKATARELERVADHAERIGELAAEIDDPPAEPIAEDFQEIGDTARGIVEDAVGVVIGDEPVESTRRALAVRDRVRESVRNTDRRLFEAAGADYRLTRVLDSLERTAEHGGNVAELGLRSAVRDGDVAIAAADGQPDDSANDDESTEEDDHAGEYQASAGPDG